MADYQQNNHPPFGLNTNALDEAEEFYKRRSQDSTIQQPDSRRSSVRFSQAESDLTSRIDTTAASSSHIQPSQPLNDAVTSAVHTTDSTMSPEIIQLITQKVYQNVLHQLQNNQPITSTAPPVQPPISVLTGQPDTTSTSSNSPSFERAQLYASETPQRENMYSSIGAEESGTPSMRRGGAVSYDRDKSPPPRKFTENNPANEAKLRVPKPDPVRRISSDADATVLEKIWGKLFDEQGQGTERLSQLLRGIAIHLIDEYEPRNSMVVTPDKMQKFYDQTQLTESREIYPWRLVFDDRTSCISRLYREQAIQAEHHLTQSDLQTRPDVPGLTPRGFATWMTFLLKAHPEHEFERLAKTLKTMAIDNPDDKSERFPKELSRRQFPASADDETASKLVSFLDKHCKVSESNGTSSFAESDQYQTPSSPRKAPPAPTVEDATDENDLQDSSTTQNTNMQHSPTSKSVRLDRGRAVHTDSETSIDEDGSDVPTPQPRHNPRPIERERKPYTAQPGQGKSHELSLAGGGQPGFAAPISDGDGLRRTKSVSNQARPRLSAPIAIHQQGDLADLPPTDGVELARIQTTTGASETSRQRNRGNSNFEVETQPFRRIRSNSTYANESGQRYQSKRTNSFTKGSDYVRPSHTDPNYPTQGSTNGYTQSQYAQNGRQDQKNYPNYGQRESRYREGSRDRDRDRERDRDYRRSWTQGITNPDPYIFNSPDEYFRKQGSLPVSGSGYQYPPNAYRDRERDREGR